MSRTYREEFVKETLKRILYEALPKNGALSGTDKIRLARDKFSIVEMERLIIQSVKRNKDMLKRAERSEARLSRKLQEERQVYWLLRVPHQHLN